MKASPGSVFQKKTHGAESHKPPGTSCPWAPCPLAARQAGTAGIVTQHRDLSDLGFPADIPDARKNLMNANLAEKAQGGPGSILG